MSIVFGLTEESKMLTGAITLMFLLTKINYSFVQSINEGEIFPNHSFEKPIYFESCLPVEVMVSRGLETLRFGPMKPIGLLDPKTGTMPYANIQLRKENKHGTMLSLVGFQTKLKWPEQKRILSSLPAFRDIEILRYGTVHRNTYLQSPKVLNKDLSFKLNSRIFAAGQITGVEGYLESAAIGLLAGKFISAKAMQRKFFAPPPETVLGALLQYVTGWKGKFCANEREFGSV